MKVLDTTQVQAVSGGLIDMSGVYGDYNALGQSAEALLALGLAGATCTSAVLQGGANIATDLSCAASASNFLDQLQQAVNAWGYGGYSSGYSVTVGPLMFDSGIYDHFESVNGDY